MTDTAKASRRGFLRGAGGLLAAAGASLPLGTAEARPHAPHTPATEPFWGAHQAGILTPPQRHTYVAAFDIALIPGLTLYSSPLKLFEYMYLCRAIVAPDTDNIREILTDGHDSVLFDLDRKGAMEAAVLRLCEDNALRARVGTQAGVTIEEKSLTWKHNAERVVALAEAAIHSRS